MSQVCLVSEFLVVLYVKCTVNIQKQGTCSELTDQRAPFWQESYSENLSTGVNDVSGTIAFLVVRHGTGARLNLVKFWKFYHYKGLRRTGAVPDYSLVGLE